MYVTSSSKNVFPISTLKILKPKKHFYYENNKNQKTQRYNTTILKLHLKERDEHKIQNKKTKY